MRRPRAETHRYGLTLLEVVLAMSILVVLSSMTYWFYSSSLEVRTKGTAEAQKLRLVRAVLDRMTTEIRQASAITADHRVGIRGLAEHIWLSSYRLPSRNLTREPLFRGEQLPVEYDLVKVEYKIARHPEIKDEDGFDLALGLARVAIPIPRPDSAQTGEGLDNNRRIFGNSDEVVAQEEARREERDLGGVDQASRRGPQAEVNWEELYAPEIKYLRLCYFDGSKWWDSWELTGENPLPQLVKVTIGFHPAHPFDEEFSDPDVTDFCTCLNEDPVECLPLPSDRYSMTVHVPQADPFFRSRISREAQSIVKEAAGGTSP